MSRVILCVWPLVGHSDQYPVLFTDPCDRANNGIPDADEEHVTDCDMVGMNLHGQFIPKARCSGDGVKYYHPYQIKYIDTQYPLCIKSISCILIFT